MAWFHIFGSGINCNFLFVINRSQCLPLHKNKLFQVKGRKTTLKDYVLVFLMGNSLIIFNDMPIHSRYNQNYLLITLHQHLLTNITRRLVLKYRNLWSFHEISMYHNCKKAIEYLANKNLNQILHRAKSPDIRPYDFCYVDFSN